MPPYSGRYEFDEPRPRGKGVIDGAVFCNNSGDVFDAISEYEERKQENGHYLILEPIVAQQYGAWREELRWKIAKFKFRKLGAIASLTGLAMGPVGWAVTAAASFMAIDGARDASKAAESDTAFFHIYCHSTYKYQDGRIGVNLSKLSREGRKAQLGQVPW
jgi:hypothetical protein